LERALSARGEYGRSLALLGEAASLSRALDDRARLGQVLINLASERMEMGNLDTAIVAGQQALELAVALGESALQVRAAYTLGRVYRATGDFARSAELLRRNVEAADRESGTSGTELRLRSRASLALTLSMLGAFAEGQCHGEEALRLAIQEGRGSAPIMAYGCLGLLSLAQGELAHAIRVLEPGLVLCRASDNRDWLQVIAAGLGTAYALRGQLTEGRVLLEESLSESLRTGARGNRAFWVVRLSEVCRLMGRSEEAWQHARQASSPWPTNSACTRSWRTATSDSARCMPRPVSGSRPVLSCLLPSRCIAPWR
jgi:tetratricopeptide (TPR) repeat protein